MATKYFPLLFVGTSAAYMALAIPLGRVADRVGRARVFLIGHVVLLGVYALTASGIGGGAWSVVLVLLLLGSFYAATDGVLAALATQSVPEESRASGIAAAQTVVALSRFACSVGFGLLWQLTGRETALWVMAAALVVGLAAAALAAPPAPDLELGQSSMKRARLIVIMISAVLCLGLAGGYFVYVRAQGSSTITGVARVGGERGQRARRAPHRVPQQRARRSLRTVGSRPLGRSGRCSRELRLNLRADVRDENGWCLPIRQTRRSADLRDHHAGCPAAARRAMPSLPDCRAEFGCQPIRVWSPRRRSSAATRTRRPRSRPRRSSAATGRTLGNIESWKSTVDGRPLRSVDRNFWGVTFADDDDTFYATAASGSTTWLMRGSLKTKSMISLRTDAECPSLSPDQTKVAYKKRLGQQGARRVAARRTGSPDRKRILACRDT